MDRGLSGIDRSSVAGGKPVIEESSCCSCFGLFGGRTVAPVERDSDDDSIFECWNEKKVSFVDSSDLEGKGVVLYAPDRDGNQNPVNVQQDDSGFGNSFWLERCLEPGPDSVKEESSKGRIRDSIDSERVVAFYKRYQAEQKDSYEDDCSLESFDSNE